MNNLYTQSSLPYAPPNASGLAGLYNAPKMQGYGKSFSDNVRSLGGRVAADYAVDASKVGSDYDLARQEAAQSLALSGLTQAAEGEQNRDQIANAYMGSVSPLLRMLFQ